MSIVGLQINLLTYLLTYYIQDGQSNEGNVVDLGLTFDLLFKVIGHQKLVKQFCFENAAADVGAQYVRRRGFAQG